jgi:hypothetical protein
LRPILKIEIVKITDQWVRFNQKTRERERASILTALGANLPSRRQASVDTLTAALAGFADRSITIEKGSGFYRSAWPDPNDPPFINAVRQCARIFRHRLCSLRCMN